MKILQICFRPPIPANDGGAIAMYNIADGFTNHKDVEHHIFTINTPKHAVKLEELKQAFPKSKVGNTFIQTEVNIVRAFFNLFSSISYNICRFDDLRAKKDLADFIKNEKYDIIHFEGLYASPFLATINRTLPKAKTVLRSHNIEHLIWKRLAEKASFVKKWYFNDLAKKLKNYEDKITPKFDAIVPITEVDEPYFRNLNCSNIFTSSTGILKSFFSKENKHKNHSVFHIGSLDWMPNQEGIIWFIEKVWPIILSQSPNTIFYVAGKNTPEWIRKYESDSIKFLGKVDSAVEFMCNHGLMIVPLLSGSGMRIKIIEGMALACPIVSTTIGAEGIIYRESKDLLIADTPKKFAETVISLLVNKEIRQSLGKNAKETALKSYANHKKIDELIYHYQSIL